MDHLKDKEGMQLLRSKTPKLLPILNKGGESVTISKTWFFPLVQKRSFWSPEMEWDEEYHEWKQKDFQIESNINLFTLFFIYLLFNFSKVFEPGPSNVKKNYNSSKIGVPKNAPLQPGYTLFWQPTWFEHLTTKGSTLEKGNCKYTPQLRSILNL